jgi:acyl-CoA reductase-like NAD-dependent aldehyde dehydrogenase
MQNILYRTLRKLEKSLMKPSTETLQNISFELGGNGLFMVFDDISMDVAVQSITLSRCCADCINLSMY